MENFKMKDNPYDFKKYKILIPEDLDHLIKGFLSRRSDEVKKLDSLMDNEDWDELARVAHKIKGHGGGFGFEGISKIGEKIETAAEKLEKSSLRLHIIEYHLYLDYLNDILTEHYDL